MSRDDALMTDIIVYARRAMVHLQGMDRADFVASEMAQDAAVRCLGVIGESATRLSDDALTRWDDVPWAAIVGMRNRLVHEYGAVDVDEVYRTVVVDLPVLLERLGPLPADTEDAG